MAADSLSFTLRRVEVPEDLAKVCEIRVRGYGHHSATIRDHMMLPDLIDKAPDTVIFLCEDKASGATVGTMRVQTNLRAGAQVEIEKYLNLPDWIQTGPRAEMSRLVILAGSDPLVKAALWKAGYMYCMASAVRWLVIGARKPGLIKQYQYLGAKDMYPDRPLIPLGHGWNLPHRILALNIASAEQDWYATNHRLLRFMVETEHPDISIASVKRAAPPRRLTLIAA
jgi:hypothetical protein